MYNFFLNLTKQSHLNVVVTISEFLQEFGFDRLFNPSPHDGKMRLFRDARRAIYMFGGLVPTLFSFHPTQLIAATSLESEEQMTQGVLNPITYARELCGISQRNMHQAGVLHRLPKIDHQDSRAASTTGGKLTEVLRDNVAQDEELTLDRLGGGTSRGTRAQFSGQVAWE